MGSAHAGGLALGRREGRKCGHRCKGGCGVGVWGRILSFFKDLLFIYLINFWLHQVLVAAHGIFVEARGIFRCNAWALHCGARASL